MIKQFIRLHRNLSTKYLFVCFTCTLGNNYKQMFPYELRIQVFNIKLKYLLVSLVSIKNNLN